MVPFLYLLGMLLLWHWPRVFVWVCFAPLIVLAFRGSPREVALSCVTIALAGAFWFKWLSVYELSAYRRSLVCWTMFVVGFMLGIRLLRLFVLRLCRVRGFESQPAAMEVALFPAVTWFVLAKLAGLSFWGSCWTDLAMFYPDTAPLIWIVGARGVTFLIVVTNGLFADICFRGIRSAVVAGAVPILLLASSAIYSRVAPVEGSSVRIAAIQGNFPGPWDWRVRHAGDVILDSYLNQTRKAAELGPDIIVWPEYAIAEDIFERKDLFDKISEAARDAGCHLVLGTLSWHGKAPDGGAYRKDMAVVVSPQGEIVGRYASVMPVPTEKQWVLPGVLLDPIRTDHANIGILLCYEETSAEVVRSLCLKGADLLVSLANNSFLKQTRGIDLASLQSRLRAAENARYMVRATNTGITRVIDPFGCITDELEPFRPGILWSDVRVRSCPTVFTRQGDVIIAIIGAGLLICAIMSSVRRGDSVEKA